MSDYPMLISNKLHSFRNFSFTKVEKKRRSCKIFMMQERLFVFGYSFLFLCNPKPIHICPTAVVSNNGRTSTEHTNLGTDPLSFSCPERSTE